MLARIDVCIELNIPTDEHHVNGAVMENKSFLCERVPKIYLGENLLSLVLVLA